MEQKYLFMNNFMSQKRAFIVHGWESYPEDAWFPWLQEELEKMGYEVFVPAMPDSEAPNIEAWVHELRHIVDQLQDTDLFIGHSVGCQAIMRYIQTVSQDIKVAGVFFVAPWLDLHPGVIESQGEEAVEVARPWLETPIEFPVVKSRAQKIVAIFSEDDYFVPLEQKEEFENNLGAKIVVENGKGHYAGRDGVMDLPVLLENIKETL